MTKYEVWIEQLDGTGRILLLSGNDQEAAAGLVQALIGFSGSTSFALGVTVTHTDVTPPPPSPTGHKSASGAARR